MIVVSLLDGIEVGLLSHFRTTKSSVMESLKNSTGGQECNRLVFSSIGPVLK